MDRRLDSVGDAGYDDVQASTHFLGEGVARHGRGVDEDVAAVAAVGELLKHGVVVVSQAEADASKPAGFEGKMAVLAAHSPDRRRKNGSREKNRCGIPDSAGLERRELLSQGLVAVDGTDTAVEAAASAEQRFDIRLSRVAAQPIPKKGHTFAPDRKSGRLFMSAVVFEQLGAGRQRFEYIEAFDAPAGASEYLSVSAGDDHRPVPDVLKS